MSRSKAWRPEPKGGWTGTDALLVKYGIFEGQVFPGEMTGGLLHFKGLTLEDAHTLIKHDLLDPEDGTENSPNTTEMLEMGGRFSGVRFFGYRVLPPRDDTRITLTGFEVPSEHITRKDLIEFAGYRSDHIWEEDEVVGLRWD